MKVPQSAKPAPQAPPQIDPAWLAMAAAQMAQQGKPKGKPEDK